MKPELNTLYILTPDSYLVLCRMKAIPVVKVGALKKYVIRLIQRDDLLFW